MLLALYVKRSYKSVLETEGDSESGSSSSKRKTRATIICFDLEMHLEMKSELGLMELRVICMLLQHGIMKGD